MKSKTAPSALTVDEANAIHREWMALDPFATEAEKTRVFRLMERLPKNYLSISADGSRAVAMFSGQPANQAMPLAECVKHWGSDMSRDVAWMGDHYVASPVR